MSGGVDSSVVAHLLSAEGHDLVGVRFSLWNDPLAPAISQILPKKCCNPQTIYRANAVAKTLGIPLHNIDLGEEFKREVVDPFLEDYAKGLTPNPCIGCNRTIKFGKLLDIADTFGCEKIATGHYARVDMRTDADGKEYIALREAVDPKKDQSYFLHGLTQQQLSRVIFPLGARHKEDVLKQARTYGIPLPEHYDESQDVCFYPEKEPRAFLQRHIPEQIVPGDIRNEDGTIVGAHKGLPLYTVGQRRGLGIGGLKIPLHVIRKEVRTNTLFVAPERAAFESEVFASSTRWIAGKPADRQEWELEARMSSQGKRHRGLLQCSGETCTFRFHSPVRVSAPGQSIVFYDGDVLLGGGVICEKS
jgi:tRNA-specific 2-thiouridylase